MDDTAKSAGSGSTGSSGQGRGGGHGHQEHHQHQEMKAKAVQKIHRHGNTEQRFREFLADELENFETLFSGLTKPGVTLADAAAQLRLAIDDRKGDVEEIVALVVHGKKPAGL